MKFRLLLVIYLLLNSLVVIGADTTSLSCLAKYFRELEFESLPKLNVHPIQKIGEFLPLHRSSWEARFPGLSKKLEKIYQSFPDVAAYFRLEPNSKLKTLMNIIVEARIEKALEIRELAQLYVKEPLLHQTLINTSVKIHMDEIAKARLAKRLEVIGDELFDPKKASHIELLSGYGGTVDGELGELLIATRVGDLEARGIKYFDHFNTYSEPLKSRALAKMEELNINGEIDLVFKNEKGKMVWGEVKNYKEPLDTSAKNFDTVYTQAVKTQKMIQLLGGKIEPHLYLVNGLSARAKLALENLGIKVHGKVK